MTKNIVKSLTPSVKPGGHGGGGGLSHRSLFNVIFLLCKHYSLFSSFFLFKSRYQKGEQKRIEQTKNRGRRLSIVGLFQPLSSFVYGLVIGGVDRKAYIQMMEQEAEAAAEMKRLRIIVQDNGPIHKCQEVKQLWAKWEEQGLYIFFRAQILFRNEPN